MGELTGVQLEKKIAKLVENYGHLKINLQREDGSSEGIWAVPCSQEDKDIYDSPAGGMSFHVRLCNPPLGTWLGKDWGHKIKAITRRDMRPEALINDNFTEEHINQYLPEWSDENIPKGNKNN